MAMPTDRARIHVRIIIALIRALDLELACRPYFPHKPCFQVRDFAEYDVDQNACVVLEQEYLTVFYATIDKHRSNFQGSLLTMITLNSFNNPDSELKLLLPLRRCEVM